MTDPEIVNVVLLGASGAGKSALAAELAALPGATSAPADGAVYVRTAAGRRQYTFADAPAAMAPGLLEPAHGAVLVVSGADGVVAGTREHVEACKQAGRSVVAVYLSTPEGAADDELLELVALEVRELLTKWEAGGDGTVVAWGPSGTTKLAAALRAWTVVG